MPKIKFPIILVLAYVISNWIWVPQTLATIGVSPARLEFDAAKSGAQTQTIFLQNFGEESSKLEIQPADFSDFVNVNMPQIILEPWKTKTVEISVRPERGFETALEIIASPLYAEGMKVASGIKIPIRVKDKRLFDLQNLLIAAAAALLFTVSYYLWTHKLKTSLVIRK